MDRLLLFSTVLFTILCLWKSVAGQTSCVGECEPCKTPRGQDGQCIYLEKCPDLLSILLNKPVKAQDADYLRDSNCGFEGLQPKVCCAFGSSPSPTPVTPAPKPHIDNTGYTDNNLLPNTEECGLSANDRVYGGEATELDEFPWMALLEYTKPNGKGFYCGGVLISKRYVLTAAHCIKGKGIPRTWKLSSVRLGEYNTETDPDCVPSGVNNSTWCSDKPIDVPVEDRIAHEEYEPRDGNQYHDIALLRLSRPVEFTDYIKPICIPTSTPVLSINIEGSKMYVAGWGKTETSSESAVKLKLQVPINNKQSCADVYKMVSIAIGNGQLCAGGESGKDSCRGDSGGPLMTAYNLNGTSNWFAMGIVSFGPTPCGTAGWPGVYTKVSGYIPWILSKLKN